MIPQNIFIDSKTLVNGFTPTEPGMESPFNLQQYILAVVAGGVLSNKPAVAQLTNSTTAVTFNSPNGVITTQAVTTANGAPTNFTLNNSQIVAGSVLLVAVQSYSGVIDTNGEPSVSAVVTGVGTATITISNNNSTNALAGTLNIFFTVA